MKVCPTSQRPCQQPKNLKTTIATVPKSVPISPTLHDLPGLTLLYYLARQAVQKATP